MIAARIPALLVLACVWLAGCGQLFGPAAKPGTPGTVLAQQQEEYRLGAGHVISIRIYGGEEEFRFDRVRLNESGVLTFPFGEFTAPGRTTRELESAMVQAMRGQFLLNPKVWINIEEYRPFYMQGQVSRPGAYAYQPGMNVNRAITLAGGFRDRAAKEKIFLLRERDKTGTPVLVDLDTPVRPGDTVLVEESFF